MPTTKQIRRASMLMHLYGIRRPGALEHQVQKIQGHAKKGPSSMASPAGEVRGKVAASEVVTARVELITDPRSGEPKFIRA